MGPGSFDPGSSGLAGVTAALVALQWGRGSFDPGSGSQLSQIARSAMTLQWGRGLSTPEVTGSGTGLNTPAAPSMGPGSFDPGSWRRDQGLSRRVGPSMGPGSFDPGSSFDAVKGKCYDGLQWGRGLSTPEVKDCQADRRINHRLQWGPGSFDPGSVSRSPQPSLLSAAFNGAGVFRPRKCACANCDSTISPVLQWGRGLSTPEVNRPNEEVCARFLPSMGPGSFDPGSRPGTCPRVGAQNPFNGAGVFRPRKSTPGDGVRDAKFPFNGAGVFRPRK